MLLAAALLFLAAPLVPLPAQPEGVAWPTQQWPTGLLSEGVDADALSKLLDVVDRVDDLLGETRAVVLVQRGRLIAERYRDGFGPGTRLVSWSMAKSITQAMAGIAARPPFRNARGVGGGGVGPYRDGICATRVRRQRHLPRQRARLRDGARFRPLRAALSPRRYLGRIAHPPRGLGRLRTYAGSEQRCEHLRRGLLGRAGRPAPPAALRLGHRGPARLVRGAGLRGTAHRHCSLEGSGARPPRPHARVGLARAQPLGGKSGLAVSRHLRIYR